MVLRTTAARKRGRVERVDGQGIQWKRRKRMKLMRPIVLLWSNSWLQKKVTENEQLRFRERGEKDKTGNTGAKGLVTLDQKEGTRNPLLGPSPESRIHQGVCRQPSGKCRRLASAEDMKIKSSNKGGGRTTAPPLNILLLNYLRGRGS